VAFFKGLSLISFFLSYVLFVIIFIPLKFSLAFLLGRRGFFASLLLVFQIRWLDVLQFQESIRHLVLVVFLSFFHFFFCILQR
jgi:hypothetical protein